VNQAQAGIARSSRGAGSAAGKKVVTDGLFVESKELVGGVAIVQADTLGAAAEFAKGCPILHTGGSVEVRPFWK
jgi:hypothetical protein